MLLKPTPEQEAILAAARSGKSIAVNAFAGTGKTTTLKQLAHALPHPRRAHYIAFNKSTADDAAATFPRNTTARTAHSYAARMIRQSRYAGLMAKLGGGYVPTSSTVRELDIHALNLDVGGNHARVSPLTLASLTIETVNQFCRDTAVDISIGHVPSTPNHGPAQNEAIAEVVVEYARKAWNDVLDPQGSALRFTHQHYLKLWGAGLFDGSGRPPRFPGSNDGDLLMYDEAQDANPLLAAVVAEQKHMQLICVGDENQAINRFTGAVNAMAMFDTKIRLDLTQSWRFGQNVADVANRILVNLGASGRVVGAPGRVSHVTDSIDCDAVLCRTNVGAISELISSQSRGVKTALVGGVAEPLRFVAAAEKLKAGQPNDHSELTAFGTWTELQEFVEESPDATSLKTFVNMVDQYGTDVMRSALKAAKDIDEDSADLHISTAHRSKGREWSRVRAATDFEVDLTTVTDPSATDEPTLLLRDDLMLTYVTLTRCKDSINVGSLFASLQESQAPKPTLDRSTAGEMRAEVSGTPVLNPLLEVLGPGLARQISSHAQKHNMTEVEVMRAAATTFLDFHKW